MKKIFGAIVGLALVYIGICFSLGFVAESALKEQVEFHNKNSSSLNGVRVELTNFSRGIFGSEMDLVVKFVSSDPILNQFTISSHSKIQHGPLLVLNGFAIGAYATQSTLVINTGVEETNKKIEALLGDSIGLISANYGFNKTYSGDWTVAAIDNTTNGTQVKVDKSIVTFAGDFKNSQAPNMTSDINIGAVLIKDAVTEVTMSPWIGNMEQHFIEAGVPIANMNFGTKKISIQNSMGVPMELENLSIEQKQTVNDKKLNTLVAFRLEKFVGPIEVKNSYYQIEANNIPTEGVKKLYDVMNGAAAGSTEQQLALLMPALTELLTDGVELKIGMGSEFMDGKAVGDFNMVYHAPTDGKKITDLEMDNILALFTADLNVVISDSIVNQTPLAGQLEPLVGTYVTIENGSYQLKANFKDTQLIIGTQTIPAEQYMPMLMMTAMGMAASQHPEALSEEGVPADDEDSASSEDEVSKDESSEAPEIQE